MERPRHYPRAPQPRDRLRSPSSVPPKAFEPIGRHFGIPDRVLNVLVPEVVLQGPRVVAIVRELEPTGVAKHVWVDREWHLSGLADALDEAVETDGADLARRARKRIRKRLWGTRVVACEGPASHRRGSGARWESRS
jgi:hypothetical protein